MLLGFSAGCATTYPEPLVPIMSASEAERLIEDRTIRKKVYDGFYNTMDVSITPHDSSVLSAILDQNARIYSWNSEKYASERSRMHSEKTSKTEFFLSFFIPEKKLDDLHKKATSWRIFLDIDGRRLEGRAVKMKNPYTELQALYPHFNRFSTPYKVTFDLPVADLETRSTALTVTGPAGSVRAEFKR